MSHFCIHFFQTTMWVSLNKPFQCIFKTISAMAATGKTLSFSIIETEVATNTRHQNKSTCILFVKTGQASRATELWVSSFYVKLNATFRLCCLWEFVYFVNEILSILCTIYFNYCFLSLLCMTLSLTSNVSTYYTIHLIVFSLKKNPLLTGVYGHVGEHILNKKR